MVIAGDQRVLILSKYANSHPAFFHALSYVRNLTCMHVHMYQCLMLVICVVYRIKKRTTIAYTVARTRLSAIGKSFNFARTDKVIEYENE